MAGSEGDAELMLRFGGPFPWHGTYQGVPVVMITVQELRRLQHAKAQVAGPAQPRRKAYAPQIRVTQWDRDPELASFVRERLGKVPQAVIRQEIAARFGDARTPTASALSRFAVKWSLDRHRIAGGAASDALDGQPASTALKGRHSDPRTFDR